MQRDSYRFQILSSFAQNVLWCDGMTVIGKVNNVKQKSQLKQHYDLFILYVKQIMIKAKSCFNYS